MNEHGTNNVAMWTALLTPILMGAAFCSNLDGLVIGTLIFSLGASLVWFYGYDVLGFLRNRRRLRRRRLGLCEHCKYPVGDFAVCPECGKPTGRDA